LRQCAGAAGAPAALLPLVGAGSSQTDVADVLALGACRLAPAAAVCALAPRAPPSLRVRRDEGPEAVRGRVVLSERAIRHGVSAC